MKGYADFPSADYDRWKTTEPDPMPSAGDICTPEQDRDAYGLWSDMVDYRRKYGKAALAELADEAMGD